MNKYILLSKNIFRLSLQKSLPANNLMCLSSKINFHFSKKNKGKDLKQEKNQKIEKKQQIIQEDEGYSEEEIEHEKVASKTTIDFSKLEKNLNIIQQDLKTELQKMKLGRFTSDSFSKAYANIQGEKVKIDSLVQFVPRNANQIQINLYDTKNIDAVVKGIQLMDQGLEINIQNNKIMCTQIGANTIEAKKETVKILKKLGEQYLDKVRKARQDEIQSLKKIKDASLKNALFTAEKEIQNLYQKSHDNVEKQIKQKEKEIMNS